MQHTESIHIVLGEKDPLLIAKIKGKQDFLNMEFAFK